MKHTDHTPFSAHIADIIIQGVRADLRLTPSWMPVLVFAGGIPVPEDITLPPFCEIDDLCARESFEKDGQAALVTDIMVREGYCTYRTGSSMRQTVRRNISAGNIIVSTPKAQP